ncbi:MAG: glycosyltransferase family 39 protein, partial [Chloroflexota bacterium]
MGSSVVSERLDQGRRPLLIIIGLVIVIGLPLLFYPFGRDQGIHAYVAASWLDGLLPYKDTWVQKGPLTFLPHMPGIALFGRTEWAIRSLDLLWQIVISWLIYRIARRRLSGAGALLAVFFYLLLYFAIDFWNTSHGESFLLPFLLLGVDLYDRARLL